MKTSAFVLSALVAALLAPMTAKAAPIFYYKATALFPVQEEFLDPRDTTNTDTIIKKTSLGSKQLINLALGSAESNQKVPSDTVLAVQLDHDNPQLAKLCVVKVIKIHGSPNTVQLLTVLCQLLTSPAVNAASKDQEKGTGNGLCPGRVNATTLGDPSTNGLLQTDFCGSATGGGSPSPTGFLFRMSATGIIGDIKGKLDGRVLDGLIIKGSFTASGKPLNPF